MTSSPTSWRAALISFVSHPTDSSSECTDRHMLCHTSGIILCMLLCVPHPSTPTQPGHCSFSINRNHIVRKLTIKHRSNYILSEFGNHSKVYFLYSSFSSNYTILPRILHIISSFLDDSARFDEPFDIMGLELSECMVCLLLQIAPCQQGLEGCGSLSSGRMSWLYAGHQGSFPSYRSLTEAGM